MVLVIGNRAMLLASVGWRWMFDMFLSLFVLPFVLVYPSPRVRYLGE